MKKTLTILSLLFASGLSFGQSLSFTQHSINVEGPNAGNKDALCTMTNVSTDVNDTIFNWEILEFTTPSQWFVSLCDPKDCYTSLFVGQNKTFYLRKTNSGPLKASFDFQNVSGNSCIKVVVRSTTYPANVDTINFCGNAWLTGVNEVGRNRSLTVYPNPVKDQLNIQFQARSEARVEIYNVLGSLVKSTTLDNTKAVINVSELDKGVYFIRVKEGNSVFTKSFTKTDY